MKSLQLPAEFSRGKLGRVDARRKLAAAVLLLAGLLSSSQGGLETDSKNVAIAQQPRLAWYADNEWNIDLFGTYAFTGTKYLDDRYLDVDHAFGGGVDAKYFFHRYFGLGLEGYVLDAKRRAVDKEGVFVSVDNMFFGKNTTAKDDHLVGAVLGTFTLRYPISQTRLAPYLYAGTGALFNGGNQDIVTGGPPSGIPNEFLIITKHLGSRVEAVGQFGAGVEVRLTPRLGMITDFSWNVVNGSHNNFGMVRSGINFAF